MGVNETGGGASVSSWQEGCGEEGSKNVTSETEESLGRRNSWQMDKST